MAEPAPQQPQAPQQLSPEERAAQIAQQQSGFFSSISNLFSSVGDIFGSFFGLLEVALFAGLAYWAATTEWGKGLIGKVVDMLPDSWKATLTGLANKIGIDLDMGAALEGMDYTKFHETLKSQGVPEEVAEIIDPNDNNQTLHGVLDIVRNANGGKVTLKGFTSPETITALIQQKPDMALKLVSALKPTPGAEPSDTAKAMNASIKTIINGDQLDVLLNAQNRPNTLKILAAAMPKDAPVSEAGLATIIDKGLDANGKPTDALRKLFSDAVDGNKQAVLAGAVAAVGAANLVTLVDAQKITDPAARYVVTTLQTNPKAKAAQDALIAKLGGNAKAEPFIDAMLAPDAGTKLTQLLMSKEYVQALPEAQALLRTLPDLKKQLPPTQAATLDQAQSMSPEKLAAIAAISNNGIKPDVLVSNFLENGKFSPTRAVDMLMLPTVRNNLQQAGTANIATLLHDQNPFLSQHNIDALITFGGALQASRANQHLTPQRIGADNAVIHRIAKLATGVPVGEALKGLSSGQIAAFFSIPGNRSAFNTLLHSLAADPKMPAAQREELALLRANFDKGNGVGLGAILSDAESVKFMLEHANGKPAPGMAKFEFVQRRAMEWQGGDTLDNTQNQDILLALGKVLNTNSAPASSATPAPKAPTYGRYTGLPLG